MITYFVKVKSGKIPTATIKLNWHGHPLDEYRVDIDVENSSPPPTRVEADPPVPIPVDGLAPVREGQGDAEPRKAHYGDGVQPWDVIVAEGWGPAFAASNVVKYLRRTKNPAHSVESARWYYVRLYEGAAGPIHSREPWSAALARVELLLTRDEIQTLRGTA